MYGELIRQYLPTETIGVLRLRNSDNSVLFECKTIELPDKDNQSQVSCIPEGVYNVIMVANSPKIKYKHFHIINVPDRSGIKIHVANYVSQLRGCIAVGKAHADLNKDGVIDVTQSTLTLDEMLKAAEAAGYNVKNSKPFQFIIRS